jgi:hypothetical protein
MKRFIALIVLSVPMVVISFGSDLRSYYDQLAHEHTARAIAFAARRTERLGIALVDSLD